MDKSVLSQIDSIRAEIKQLNKIIDDINRKPIDIVTDSVKGSSANYPYIQHNCIIEGIDNKKVISNNRNRKKYEKQIKNKQYKLDKLINRLEYELNYVEDSVIRRIIRYRYEDNLNWVQIQIQMKYDHEDTARKQLDRFLKNI